MANMDDRYFNLGLTLGQGIRARQAEKEEHKEGEEHEPTDKDML